MTYDMMNGIRVAKRRPKPNRDKPSKETIPTRAVSYDIAMAVYNALPNTQVFLNEAYNDLQCFGGTLSCRQGTTMAPFKRSDTIYIATPNDAVSLAIDAAIIDAERNKPGRYIEFRDGDTLTGIVEEDNLDDLFGMVEGLSAGESLTLTCVQMNEIQYEQALIDNNLE